MLSEYITSLADISFHIVAYMYARFRYSGKIRCGLRFFGVFLCGFAVFGPPLRPPPQQTRPINHEKGENQRRVELQTFHFREINITKDLIT